MTEPRTGFDYTDAEELIYGAIGGALVVGLMLLGCFCLAELFPSVPDFILSMLN